MPAQRHARRLHRTGRRRRARGLGSVGRAAGSLLLALVMLALLPAGWDGSLAREPWEDTEAGYAAGAAGDEEPREQEAIAEQRSLPAPRTALPAQAARPPGRPALSARATAPVRLARPYIPHPSRFSERRLI